MTTVDLGGFTQEDLVGAVTRPWRTDHDLALIEAWLPQVSNLFTDVPKVVLYQMASTLQAQVYEPGDVVVLQGDIGHEYFIIAVGECRVFFNDSEARLKDLRARRSLFLEGVSPEETCVLSVDLESTQPADLLSPLSARSPLSPGQASPSPRRLQQLQGGMAEGGRQSATGNAG